MGVAQQICNKLICELDDLIEEKEIKLQSERTVLYNSMEKLIEKNSSFKINQTEYNKHYEKFKNQYDKINKELSAVAADKIGKIYYNNVDKIK